MMLETRAAVTAASHGLALCKSCHQLQTCPAQGSVRCARCGALVFMRKPYSLVLSWFFFDLGTAAADPRQRTANHEYFAI